MKIPGRRPYQPVPSAEESLARILADEELQRSHTHGLRLALTTHPDDPRAARWRAELDRRDR